MKTGRGEQRIFSARVIRSDGNMRILFQFVDLREKGRIER
jgi:hypothetical protein